MNKTVIITGAAKGIGRAIAKDFAYSGYNVCINYNTSEKEAKELCSELSKDGCSVIIYQADITKRAEVDKMVDYVIKKDSVSAMKISQNIKFDNLELLEYLEYILYSNKMYNGVCVVERAISRLKRNGNYDIVIDNMILKIIDEI